MFIQARVLGEYNPKELVANSVDAIAVMVEEEKTLLEIMKKKMQEEIIAFIWRKTECLKKLNPSINMEKEQPILGTV